MAQRRMISLEVVDTDAFLDMPVSAQLLYFHLNARADDDGFIANPKRIMRTVQVGSDDMKILLAKKFILEFNDGVCVIKHWRVNNFIRKDIYKETQYMDLKTTLFIRPNGAYSVHKEGAMPVPEGHFKLEDVVTNTAIQSPKTTLTVRRRDGNIGKDRIGKEREGKITKATAFETKTEGAILNELIELFREVNPSVNRMYANKNQRLALDRLVEQHGREKIESTIMFLPKSNAAQYAPTITTPVQLENELGKLIAWSKKQKDSKKGKAIII